MGLKRRLLEVGCVPEWRRAAAVSMCTTPTGPGTPGAFGGKLSLSVNGRKNLTSSAPGMGGGGSAPVPGRATLGIAEYPRPPCQTRRMTSRRWTRQARSYPATYVRVPLHPLAPCACAWPGPISPRLRGEPLLMSRRRMRFERCPLLGRDSRVLARSCQTACPRGPSAESFWEETWTTDDLAG